MADAASLGDRIASVGSPSSRPASPGAHDLHVHDRSDDSVRPGATGSTHMAGWIATALYLLDLAIKVVALGCGARRTGDPPAGWRGCC